MTITKTTDHVSEALDHYVEQFKGKPKFAALMTALVNQIQDLEDASFETYLDRWIDSAVGVQLDGLGDIVGEAREGRGDDEYRLAIKAQIQINFSEATPEDILTALVNFDPRTYELIEIPPAAFIIRLVDAWIDGTDPDPEDFQRLLNEVNGAGIRAWFQYSGYDDDDVFTWASGDTEEASETQGFGEDPLYVAVSESGVSDGVMTSPDGETWTSQTAADVAQWYNIAWSFDLGLFVAVSPLATTNQVMTSPNGVDWTQRVAAEANQWTDVAWSPDLEIFVAVAASGTNRVMTSPDGITWTAHAAAEQNQWFRVTWGAGKFVAVSTDGTNRVMTSEDGETWTAHAATEANTWTGVVYSESLGIFAAVSYDGTNRAMTSTDGETWTARAPTSRLWRNIVWSETLGLFMLVSQQGEIGISADGITWTEVDAPETNNYLGITAFDGRVVAVSKTGTYRVARSGDGYNWSAETAATATGWRSVTHGYTSGGRMSEIIGG